MFTALGVLIDVNISNKYKRRIIINKKKENSPESKTKERKVLT